MTTEIVKETLQEISDHLVNEYEFDPVKRTMYGVALDTAIRELDNYERLIEEMLSYRQQTIINEEHHRVMQSLRYGIFKEGGTIL